MRRVGTIVLIAACFIVPTSSASSQGNGAILGCEGFGGVIVGVQGQAGAWIDGLEVQCVQVKDDGSWVGLVIPRGHVGGYGGMGSRDFQETCPANYAVVAVQGTRGTYVNTVKLVCKPLTPGGKLGGATQSLSHYGGDIGPTPFGPLACTPNDVPAFSIFVHAATWLDSIDQINCGAASTYSLKSFTTASSMLVGGNPLLVTLTMNLSTPPGGAPVAIVSSNPTLIASQTVTVPYERASGNFSLPTKAVAIATSVQLTARFGVGSVPVTVTLIPPLVKPSR